MVIRVLPPINISPEKLKLKNDIKNDMKKLKLKNSKKFKKNEKNYVNSIHDIHMVKSLRNFEKSLMKFKGDNKDGDVGGSDRVVEIHDDDEGIYIYMSTYLYL
jgi:hypothetical protein